MNEPDIAGANRRAACGVTSADLLIHLSGRDPGTEGSSRERRAAPEGAPPTPGHTPGPARERRSGIQMTPEQVAVRRAPQYLEGPLWSLICLGVSLVLAALLLAIGFSQPSHRIVSSAGAYHQVGVFGYAASVKAPTEVYPSGEVTTGQPIYSDLVDNVTLRFDYRFTSALPHHISGTIALRGLVLAKGDTWQELSMIKATRLFRGDRASLASTVALSDLYGLIGHMSAESGVVGTIYSADMQPVVKIVGTVGGKSIHETFAPVLPFDVSPTSAIIDTAVPAPVPGATYVVPSASSVLAAVLHPVQSGSVPEIAPNTVSVAKYQVPVTTLRILGITFAALAVILALLHEVGRRRITMRSPEEAMANRARARLVPVNSLDMSDGSQQIEIPDFAHLAELAQFLRRPILYEMRNGGRRYAVHDEALRYFYRPWKETAHEDSISGSL